MTANATIGSLGAFLQASRARITPDEAGLTLYGDRRRVPGLRREELAMLAGVSVSYLTRLEQGQSRGASLHVLDALAAALHLDDAERQHLRRLAEHLSRRTAPKRPAAEVADPALAELLRSVDDVPALVLGRRSDVLAWNPLGHALLGGHLDADAPAVSTAYMVRATSPGTFVMPGATVEDMYRPEQRGNTDAVPLEIGPPAP